eukprot:TRINITY_DN2189_c0_g1_i1.p1 TRINITY_DN2189_c0_g1~~TRINITY_DN2189_c0_g1_i1.p1  ORF type:complete len:782 (-),score=227.80 TRINITY_DN2189_c0_g1_i1:93-2438(-)
MSMTRISHVPVATIGFPRMGSNRQLKNALESFWNGKISAEQLLKLGADLRASNWKKQSDLGATLIPSNDFSLYDQILDMSVTVGAIPATYNWDGGVVSIDTYFAMARGTRDQSGSCAAGGVQPETSTKTLPAAEMTKWFDTNYHYLVPEFAVDQKFVLASTKAVDEFVEAKNQGHVTRPVLVGPVTYLKLGKMTDKSTGMLRLLPSLLPIIAEVLNRLHAAGAEWVQIDEPCLVLDLTEYEQTAYRTAYEYLAKASPVKLMLTTYFGALGGNIELATTLPVAGLHIDLVRAPEQLGPVLERARPDLVISAGVVDGRNVWRADLEAIVQRLEPVVASGRSLIVAPSCSLLHLPYDLNSETGLLPELKSWLAFAVQKVEELAIIARALNDGRASVRAELDASSASVALRKSSSIIHKAEVQARLNAVTPEMSRRKTPYASRAAIQRAELRLPLYPTTTIGSFPQTAEVRQKRAAFTKGSITPEEYERFLREETARTVRWQEECGLDVLVHGEFERNDMVQYFGEQLDGFAFTQQGWVQSYGSRCVRPPILFGDVSRPKAMTVSWWQYAQSVTDKPMKGMLTGPVTILNWSFVRDDVPESVCCQQIALAIRDEVVDLEAAGAKVIQIDEAALREGMPLRRGEWPEYMAWAVGAFRLASSGVADGTQIHTHMCYSEFNEIIASIGDLDTDVISIETARSKMELLDAFAGYAYASEIGPGVYDIHSPRVPTVEEMVDLMQLAGKRLDVSQLWVNPDCGLKTRGWPEVRLALVNMVEAARRLRVGTK